MTGEAYLAISAVLLAMGSFFMWRQSVCLEQASRHIHAATRALNQVGREQRADFGRSLVAMKRTESRMMKTRAQMEIATKACWSMLGRAGGKANRKQPQGGQHEGT